MGQIPTYLASGAYYRDRCPPLKSEEPYYRFLERLYLVDDRLGVKGATALVAPW